MEQPVADRAYHHRNALVGTSLLRHEDEEAGRLMSKVRCAFYNTRKSSEEGLEQDLNSLDAQYERPVLPILKSQASEGWTLIRDRYDDGGSRRLAPARPRIEPLVVRSLPNCCATRLF